MEDSGEVTVMLVPQDRLDFLDGYTGSKKRKTRGSGKPKKTQCVVCMDADANISFVHLHRPMPTAHLVCCEACAKKFKGRMTTLRNLRNDSDTDDDDVIEKCPVCRQDIHFIVKQF